MTNALNREPSSKPPFTISQLRKTIPPRCFRRSLLRSSAYLLVDLIAAYFLNYVASKYIHLLPSPLPFFAWPFYFALQGCALVAIVAIGHECGHHAFSDHHWLNDIVGLLLHSSFLIPYFSWKHSHRRHHSNTNNLEFDEVFLPKQKFEIRFFSKFLNNPPGRVLTILTTLVAGWPLYLAFNVSGRNYHDTRRFISHYNPYSPIFSDKERIQILVSDSSIIIVICCLLRFAALNGASHVVLIYFAPLGVMYGFLVLITILQHTHASVPHYDSSEWDWLRGALATIDRDYGVLNRVFHHVTDTHVVHHLFPTMPHYHAAEATEAVRPVLGRYYRFDRTPILKALWRETRECVYIEKEGERGVFWYNNKL